jgi:hypothetical protein
MIADFDRTYHAILGRPSLTKFVAVPHYSYLVLKMPTEKGVLTVRGNVYTAYTCEEESFKITEAIDLSIRMAETVAQATQISPTSSNYPSRRLQEKAPSPRTTRKSNWSTAAQRRRLSSGPIWTPNRKTCSSGF